MSAQAHRTRGSSSAEGSTQAPSHLEGCAGSPDPSAALGRSILSPKIPPPNESSLADKLGCGATGSSKETAHEGRANR